ncbi:MAG: folK [Gammaproteobacteria bacterium]|nr:MAG: folK [Gammaproteobacteria bacterium]TND06646.1 MAG: folK [Gammaproteobacteria bacterium]
MIDIAPGTPPMGGSLTEVHAYVGLGANLGNPVRQLLAALDALEHIPATRVIASSSLYRSRPMGDIGQPDFINAVAALATGLTPLELLEHLQRIEREQGRVRTVERWGPRRLDLDLLLYGDETIRSARLQVPHPGLCERDFVLCPLNEIAPHLEIAGLGTVADLLARCRRHDVQRVGRPAEMQGRAGDSRPAMDQ